MYVQIFIFILFFTAYIFPGEVFVNQAGYLTRFPKFVYFSQQADSFFVLSSSTNKIEFRSSIQLENNLDPATGLTIYSGDFSSFEKEGNYFITTNNSDASFNFEISGKAFNNTFNASLKSFYYQRCGSDLLPLNAGVYSRARCHTADGFYHSSTGQPGFHYAPKGWHDAGDFGKYIVNAGVTVGTLLLDYELFPEKFSTDELNIPESGNKIPDILDEVKYELEWFLTMQDNSDGGVYFKVTPKNFSGFIMPSKDNSIRYIYEKSSTATADFGAVMAKAARVFKSFDSTFAKQCLNAAIEAWEYLEAIPYIVPDGGFHNPSDTYTGEYGDGNDSDERLWAAAELFITTGETKYEEVYSGAYKKLGLINSSLGWQNVKTLAHVAYLTGKQSLASPEIKIELKNSLINYCNSLVERSNQNGFGVAINPGEYYWGSNSDVLNKAVLLIIGYELTGNNSYMQTALQQFNYVLGINAHNLSFITGIGTQSVMHPHHRPSAADGIDAPIPGFLAGGPNQYLNDPVLQSHFNDKTPPALCYLDNVESYASNEVAINWNAPLVFVAGYFNDTTGITGIIDESKIIPQGIYLEQNYPNPFNGTTKIRYTLAPSLSRGERVSDLSGEVLTKTEGRVRATLKIYDVLGNEVTTLVNKEQQPGTYEVEFNTNAINKYSSLASGIYFYSLVSSDFFQTKKMIYLK